MITTTEMAATITIWALTAAGGFFGGRTALRRRRRERDLQHGRGVERQE